MGDDDLCYLSASEARRRFRAGTLSPVELIDALIGRAEAVEGWLTAFTWRAFDAAREAARRAEARYRRPGARLRPLEGIPVAIKDEQEITGQPTTMGSLIYRDNVATETSPAIARILRAGAIVHARTVTPEFSCVPVCHSRLWGVSRNPWNTEFDPGGSSGGSAIALAAGLTTLANGTDYAGSIRIPASACGVVGYKPPYGRNPESPPFSLDPYNHIGPLARTVADCALLQNVMSGPYAGDMATLPRRLRIPERLEGIRGWRIAYSLDLGYFRIDPAVRDNTLAALEGFREAGATVEEVSLDWTLDVLTACHNHLEMVFGGWIGQALEGHRHLLTDYARRLGEMAQGAGPRRFLAGMEVEGRMWAGFAEIMRRHDVFVCPTLAVPAVAAGHDCFAPGFAIDGGAVDGYLQWCLTYPFNMLNRCPAITVPSGLAATGVPTGIQIVARAYDDIAVFRAAAAFEAVRPWAERRPPL